MLFRSFLRGEADPNIKRYLSSITGEFHILLTRQPVSIQSPRTLSTCSTISLTQLSPPFLSDIYRAIDSFNNNTAFFSGGAVEWSGANGFLSGCSFNNNHAAESSGGAVYWVGDNGFLSGCSFNNNHAAESSGGAVCWFW